MTYRMGVDAGSKTIKIVVVDEDGDVVYSRYRRHKSNIVSTLRAVFDDLVWKMGDIEGTLTITGSAGIGVSDKMGVPFVQEVIASARAVRELIPDADAIVELGGEDAKVIYLTGGLEQRMNATCAGGTGGFIDTIAFMLGVKAADMSRLAFGSSRLYPIASRCAVFAQTDVRPLLNSGASKEDIAASALDAVVRQTLGGLACGRPLHGKVVFLGGPFEHIPYLLKRFCEVLGLDACSGVKPSNAHLFVALGAALTSLDTGAGLVRASEIVKGLSSLDASGGGLRRLPPLFDGDGDIRAFKERHAAVSFPRARLFDAKGPLFVGIDAGSTTVKIAVLDESGMMVHSAYRPAKGDVLAALAECLTEFYRNIPRSCGRTKEPYAWVAHAAVTGYGEDMILSVIGADSGVVETVAHLRAAQELCPDVSFVLDIGGQDVKALWVEEGQIVDAVLNEACSSGCGAFVEGTAYSLGSTPADFSELAMRSSSPLDLGTKCTVFMTSRVRHAQKTGASLDDIAAGVAYSVVQNALYRIIGVEKIASMGDRIVVQGGAFKSDAVLRAFEKISHQRVLRCEQSHLMGALGAALVARDVVDRRCGGNSDGRVVSGIASQEELEKSRIGKESFVCPGCGNLCVLSVVKLGEARLFATGNRCARGLEEAKRFFAGNPVREDESSVPRKGEPAVTEGDPCCNAQAIDVPPNVIALEQRIIEACRRSKGRGGHLGVRLGVVDSLGVYEQVPFWHAFFSSLGFDVVFSSIDASNARDAPTEGRAWGTVPSESVCYPAKTSHLKYFDLVRLGVDFVFMPRFVTEDRCPVASGYADALSDNIGDGLPPLVAPRLLSDDCEVWAEDASSRHALKESVERLAGIAGAEIDDAEFACALRVARGEQKAFGDKLEEETQRALAWLSEENGRRGVVVVGRPYHMDSALLNGIDGELAKLGYAVLCVKGLGDGCRESEVSRDDVRGFLPARRCVAASSYVRARKGLDVVYLQSFGCGYDAVSIEMARESLDAAGSPYAILKIDEMCDTAHVRIRLRTMAAASGLRRIQSAGSLGSSALKRKRTSEKRCAVVAISGADGFEVAEHVHGTAQVGSTSTSTSRDLLMEHEASSRDSMPCFDVQQCDIDEVRRGAIKDICFTTSVIASRAARLARECPEAGVLKVPAVCEGCLSDALAYAIERQLGSPSQLMRADLSELQLLGECGSCMEEEPAHCMRVGRSFAVDDEGSSEKPKVGILGNALMCFSPKMNDHLKKRIEELGCEAVLPDPSLLTLEDIAYPRQLERFYEAGVRDVIYVQSFGCLKGHVHVRGALHELKRRYPHMNVTIVDFDPEASALNRENRIRLAIEAARAAHDARMRCPQGN